jgi:hypothetical protein
MIAFIYRCPRTGQQVQGWAADHLARELYCLRADSSRQPEIRQGAGGRRAPSRIATERHKVKALTKGLPLM